MTDDAVRAPVVAVPLVLMDSAVRAPVFAAPVHVSVAEVNGPVVTAPVALMVVAVRAARTVAPETFSVPRDTRSLPVTVPFRTFKTPVRSDTLEVYPVDIVLDRTLPSFTRNNISFRRALLFRFSYSSATQLDAPGRLTVTVGRHDRVVADEAYVEDRHVGVSRDDERRTVCSRVDSLLFIHKKLMNPTLAVEGSLCRFLT